VDDIRLTPGSPAPLGASYDGRGTNFAVFSTAADQVWLCLFDEQGREQRLPLTEVDAWIWHGYAPGVGPGARYGFRVDGWNPERGRRGNPAKLLLDPYALAVDGPLDWGSSDADAEALFDYRWADGSRNDEDSAPRVPRSVVVDPSFDWGPAEHRPRRSLADTVVYETHVRGMTRRHPDVPAADRGTFRGLAHPAVTGHLRALGVTAVELLPVQQFFANRGQTNFWGYDPICFLAPHGRYAAGGPGGGQVREFQAMVKALHDAGLEVILDVVFNHTFEGGGPSRDAREPSWRVGPSVSLRGLDNASYYMLDIGSPPGVPYYVNETGVGNTLNIWDPAALRLIMDALRHWVQRMHVDGFRFDLGAVLAQTDEYHSISVFLDLVSQDPVLGTVKLIAEPWFGDRHPQMLGRFPPLWSQWNGDFHWAMRDFWKSTGSLRAMTEGLRGSPEIFDAAAGERPTASVNYAASHDGLNLHDSVAYTDAGQHAWDCRAPGQADDDPEVVALRARMARNLLATAVLAQGVPMILYGDECGRTQDGNANPYDVDSPLTWMPWGDEQDAEMLAYTRRLVALRRDHPVFRRRRFFQTGDGIAHHAPDGRLLGDAELDQTGPCAVTVHLDGDAIPDAGPDGRPVRDSHSFLLLLNAGWDPSAFAIPPALPGPWHVELASERPDGAAPGPDPPLDRPGRSLLVLSRPSAAGQAVRSAA
jgi:glycogen operon protein